MSTIAAGTTTTTALVSTGDTTGALVLQTNGTTTAATFNANQTTTFISTISVGNATPSTSGSGITFPATQSASSDANTLDDYEEGTYTPTIANAVNTTSLSVTYAKYTKIGREVLVEASIAGTVTSSASATGFTVTLPLTATSTGVSSGSVYVDAVAVGAVQNNNTTTAYIWFIGGSGISSGAKTFNMAFFYTTA
jgi:hypothetical protein